VKLNGTVVLITGGSSGIGAACARELAKRGAHVSVVDVITPASELMRPEHLFIPGDITDAQVRQRAIERTIGRYGAIDILLNNAGAGLYAPAADACIETSRRVFDLNVFAALGMAQLVIPFMKQRSRGVIVNLGSIGGDVALPWAPLYCASKFSLHCISESLRRELKRYGIRVITIKPGVVDTAFRSHVLAGVAPPKVGAIPGMAAADLATAIANKIEGRGSSLYKPWYGRVFALADRFLPVITDIYIQRHCADDTRKPGYSPASGQTSRANAEHG
jgi:NAD(P)-dependent dehydrogenase (short-subunit alcohol dehydrogenase family)